MTRTKGRSCEGKKQFTSKVAAKKQIDSMYKGKVAVTRLVAYRCKFCGFWHVGHSRFGGRR